MSALPPRDVGTLGRPRHLARVVKDRTQHFHLKTRHRARGRVLLSYIMDPFRKPRSTTWDSHPQHWESRQIAATFLEFGYDVDVVSYLNRVFRPRRDYAVFIDARRNMERLGPSMSDGCVKIMHLDTSHLLFHNAAEHRRLLALQQRRGVTLQPRRVERINFGLEHADCATLLGNEITQSTYSYAGKPIHRLPVPCPTLYPWRSGKDFDACRNRWMWLGSGGMVHKGLDLVLEAFAAMPDQHLTVCGPVAAERDFAAAYHAELYDTANISTLDWVDVAGAVFEATLQSCVGMVFPSCSEGQSGSVVNAMHAGLIPVVTPETGVDIEEDFGVMLPEASFVAIQRAVRDVTGRPAAELRSMARAAWERARADHTRERFAAEYERTVRRILAEHCS